MKTDAALPERSAAISRVLLLTFLCNGVVSGAKLTYGYFSGSVSIAADGFHSMFDGISNLVGFAGIYFSSRPPDEEHPYGHRKYETIFTIFIGIMMFLSCFEIMREVYLSFYGDHQVNVTNESFAIMLFTMGVNIFVTTYEKRMGRKFKSEFLIADAKHTQSDIYATAGVIGGLILMKLGFRLADSIVGGIVGVLVARAGIGILRDAAEVLADRKQAETDVIRRIVCDIGHVRDCHRIRTRGTNNCIFIDLHIVVDPELSIEAGHEIAHQAEERLKERVSGVVDVVIHIEPTGTDPEK